jgi:hypothetical protein
MPIRLPLCRLVGSIALGLLGPGCMLPFGNDAPDGGSTSPEGGPTNGGEGGISTSNTCSGSAGYASVAASLDKQKKMFLGPNVQDLTPVGNRIYWYDTTNYAPVLDGENPGGAPLAYTFGVGDSIDDANWSGSASLIVTAQPSSNGVTYYAYDPTQAKKEIGHITVPAPECASYWAYAVDDGVVYLVMTDTHQDNALIKWVPAAGSSTTTVTTLESAGVTVGEFWGFDVSGNTMVFIESGAIWTLDIATNKAKWLMNTTEVASNSEVDFESDGVMFNTDTALMFFDYEAGTLENLSEQIHGKRYSVGACSGGASDYATDFARWGNVVVYIGADYGVFAYDMTKQEIAPVLLPPESGSSNVQYRYPVALPDGTLFVTGLTSSDCTTGQGPTYDLSLPSVIQ